MSARYYPRMAAALAMMVAGAMPTYAADPETPHEAFIRRQRDRAEAARIERERATREAAKRNARLFQPDANAKIAAAQAKRARRAAKRAAGVTR